ncbi:nudix hydrolase 15, mitochondrial-like [Quillaja saponaria]|uniref:Nudix hydrolase 15, mitochondrial-like n=1 Tax=Quillaja saponaria TaxID=32244 RepID=A0AAD7PVT8_QUISA|nr:nudix hydrolase 15, mitochondrial-like [Quillaja saponaria]
MDSDRLGSQKLEDLAQYLRSSVRPSDIDLIQYNIKPIKRAAVLVCLFEGDNEDLRVILTKRASSLSTHPGEVALPGGKREEGDANDLETALREAKEEIGLDPSLVHVLGLLEPFVTKAGVMVIPVVGILPDKNAFTPVLNAAEVEVIFDAPLDMFLKDDNRRSEEREWMGDKYLLHFFDFEVDNKKHVIWALTAGILIKAASVLYQQQPEFPERRPKFWSANAADNDNTALAS